MQLLCRCPQSLTVRPEASRAIALRLEAVVHMWSVPQATRRSILGHQAGIRRGLAPPGRLAPRVERRIGWSPRKRRAGCGSMSTTSTVGSTARRHGQRRSGLPGRPRCCAGSFGRSVGPRGRVPAALSVASVTRSRPPGPPPSAAQHGRQRLRPAPHLGERLRLGSAWRVAQLCLFRVGQHIQFVSHPAERCSHGAIVGLPSPCPVFRRWRAEAVKGRGDLGSEKPTPAHYAIRAASSRRKWPGQQGWRSARNANKQTRIQAPSRALRYGTARARRLPFTG